MSPSRYTIGIPTRNRATYLRSGLAGALATAGGRADVQILVSDNSDDDQTAAVRAVIAEVGQGRVDYVRPDRAPVSMSLNWEFLTRHAGGQYLLVLGDDDALLPSALDTLDRVLAAAGDPPAVQWPFITYYWPDYFDPVYRDRLAVPVLTPAERNGVRWEDGLRQVQRVFDAEVPYTVLPLLYFNSAIRRDVRDRMLDGSSPRFPASAPDVYSGFAAAVVAGRYLTIQHPLGICGLSHKSNGMRQMTSSVTGADPVVSDFNQLNAAGRVRQPDGLPWTPTIVGVMAEAALIFLRQHPGPSAGVRADFDRLALAAARELSNGRVDAATRADGIGRLAAQYPHLAGRLKRELARPLPPQRTEPLACGFDGSALTVQPSLVGATDVAGAAALADMLLGGGPAGPPPQPTRASRAKALLCDLLPPATLRAVARLRR